MSIEKFLNNNMNNDSKNKKYTSNPELIKKNADDLMKDKNFQAVMEALSDK